MEGGADLLFEAGRGVVTPGVLPSFPPNLTLCRPAYCSDLMRRIESLTSETCLSDSLFKLGRSMCDVEGEGGARDPFSGEFDICAPRVLGEDEDDDRLDTSEEFRGGLPLVAAPRLPSPRVLGPGSLDGFSWLDGPVILVTDVGFVPDGSDDGLLLDLLPLFRNDGGLRKLLPLRGFPGSEDGLRGGVGVSSVRVEEIGMSL